MRDNAWMIPYEYAHIVCTCETPKFPKESHKKGEIMKCANCDRCMRYYIAKCQRCSEPSFTSFKSPRKCKKVYLCYSCLTVECTHQECHSADNEWETFDTEEVPPPAWFVKREPLDIQAVLSEDLDLTFDF